MLRSRENRLQTRLNEITTLRAIVTALTVGILGVVLIFLSTLSTLWGTKTTPSPVQSLLGNIGDLLIASVAVAVLWELAGKRAFADELLSKVHLSEDVASAGLTAITHDLNRAVDWQSLFQRVEQLDIFFAYAHSWRSTHHADLLALAQRKNARIRIVLPDPDDQLTMDELARRFGFTVEKLRGLILEASGDFHKLRPNSGPRCRSISLWYLPATPLFSFYRFDSSVILALYNHTHEIKSVPTFICEEGGNLYTFVQQEFSAMIEGEKKLARLGWEQNDEHKPDTQYRSSVDKQAPQG